MEVSQATRDGWDKAEAAFAQAARAVVERARRTGTPIIVWQDGQIKELSPEQFTDAGTIADQSRT